MKGWICINSKRLKLYDTSIEVCVNKKTKEKLRKVAYKQKITMSEYIRQLIELAIINNEINNLIDKIKKDNNDLLYYYLSPFKEIDAQKIITEIVSQIKSNE